MFSLMKRMYLHSKLWFVVFFMSLLLISCDPPPEKEPAKPEVQLNISILLDLSDRISPDINPCTPSHIERDTAIVNFIVDYFKRDMEKLGLYKAKGKIKLFCYPYPNNPKINTITKALKADCSNINNKQKRAVYKTIGSTFSNSLATIYEQAISDGDWIGSDIWRFFKNDVKDYCVDTNPNYRNILVILTDGYIYHSQSKRRVDNRFEYLLANNIKQYRGANAIQNIEKDDFGLIAERNDLNDLEVLVLEISPEKNHPNDEDILKYCIGKWLKEMNVKRYSIFNTDLTTHTVERIENFLN